MLEKLPEFKLKLDENTKALETLDISKEPKKYKELMQERSHLEEVVDGLTNLQNIENEIDGLVELSHSDDAEIKQMAELELENAKLKREQIEKSCRLAIIPPDPLDGKNIIMEIRAGTGGEEAALFAADLFKMYSKFAVLQGFKIEIMNTSESSIGGFKEIVFSISGKNVYGTLRYEAGTHRVQRVPETESGGRIHTSAATVAVLPEAEETDIIIRPEDLKIDVMRAGGPGGQCVNTTDSAVRLTHIPTGLVVIQQDEKSQLKNKNKALRVLRSRLFEMEEEKKRAERSSARKAMVGSGDRSERIRTYNFPQNRVTDHRVNLTLYHLDTFMEGQMQDILDALRLEAGAAELTE